jgi:predicted nucleic acid-binding protein
MIVLDTNVLSEAWRPTPSPAVMEADAQIAAIARSRGAAVATRNVEDFAGCGIAVVSPWKG